jgi:hypothetical protein
MIFPKNLIHREKQDGSIYRYRVALRLVVVRILPTYNYASLLLKRTETRCGLVSFF